MDEQLPPDALAALATRAAIRAQPSFRIPEELPPEGARDLIEALHVCTWSGFAAFLTSGVSPERLRKCLERARSIAEPQGGDRVESLAALVMTQFLDGQTPGTDPVARLSNRELIETIEVTASHASGLPSEAAVAAVRHDEELLRGGGVSVLGRAPLWPDDRVPHEWGDVLRDWRRALERHDLAALGTYHAEILRHVERGTFDWETPFGWIDEWGRRHGVPLSESSSDSHPADETAAPSSDAARIIPLDLASYELSKGAADILQAAIAQAAARRPPRAVSSSAVLMEMAELGRPGNDPLWIGDFLRRAVEEHSARYHEAVEQYRHGRIQRQRAQSAAHRGTRDARDPAGTAAPTMQPGLAWSLTRAREIAQQTTGAAKIAGRHLLAALIVEPPAPYTLGAQKVLKEIGIDVPLLRHQLYQWVRGYGDNDAEWRACLVGTATAPRRRPEFDGDGTAGPDLLDLEQDVVALATLIAARDSSPPLSIGLFGDWGSGKTFFMGQLRRAVARFSQEARDAQVMQRDLPFYKRIVQIEFNAWHYVEGNLWASMVEHILDNLRIFDEQPTTDTERLQQHYITQLGFTEAAQAEADRKTNQAAARVLAAEAAVRAAERQHDDKKQELQTLSRKSAARDFKLSGAFTVIAESLEPLGFKPVSAAVSQLQSSVREARTAIERGNAVLTPLMHAADRKDRWRSLLIILIGAPVVAALLGWGLTALGADRIAQISAFAAWAAGLLTGIARWVRQQAAWMTEQAKNVEKAQRTYDRALARALARMEEDMAKTEQELALARQDYLLAQQRAEQARREEAVARADLAAATTSRLLGRFVQDRASSTDYRKHLGLLAIVRQDFQKLSNLIEEDNWRLAPARPDDHLHPFARRNLKKIESFAQEMEDAQTRINRIVLYIDDLDRCPPAKVVDVLQAVHLLLAFPLFVVVVGVDARWISRSLETRYRELLHVGQADEAVDIAQMFGVARSEDYLEKIFQIPLWLRKMDPSAARRMVQGLLRSAAAPARSGNGGGASDNAAQAGGAAHGPAAQGYASQGAAAQEPAAQGSTARQAATQETAAQGAATQTQTPETSAGASAGSQTGQDPQAGHTDADAGRSGGAAPTGSSETAHKPMAPNLESLEVRDFEVLAIDGLSPLLGRSPRALKRFVNLYRLIKAGLTPAEHNAFIRRNENSFADFEAVLFLLAIDTGLPRVSRAVFDVLLAADLDQKADGPTAKQFVDALDKHPAASTSDWATLKDWLTARERSKAFNPGSLRRLATWVPRVSRYSFQAAHLEGAHAGPSRPRAARSKAASA